MKSTRGFTLIEVLVALVIVAFGVGSVLAALSSSAANVGALREKTLAQWIALNRVSDARLNLKSPQIGTTEGDIKGFANGDWHWQQIVTAVQAIPGLLQITVKVRRNVPGASTTRSSTKEPDWVTTVVGFRGAAIAVASGEVPDWSGSGLGSSSSSSGSSSSGTGTTPINPAIGPAPTPTPGTPTPPGATSSGGP